MEGGTIRSRIELITIVSLSWIEIESWTGYSWGGISSTRRAILEGVKVPCLVDLLLVGSAQSPLHYGNLF